MGFIAIRDTFRCGSTTWFELVKTIEPRGRCSTDCHRRYGWGDLQVREQAGQASGLGVVLLLHCLIGFVVAEGIAIEFCRVKLDDWQPLSCGFGYVFALILLGLRQAGRILVVKRLQW
jgi:hypothetical protein